MILGQMLRRYNDFVQIRLHELSDHINLLKEVDVRGLKEKEEYLRYTNFTICWNFHSYMSLLTSYMAMILTGIPVGYPGKRGRYRA